MDYRDEIIRWLAEKECNCICKKAIRYLQSLRDDCLQSGDDSPLENVWDEICVHVQIESSFFWDLYIETIETFILGEIKNISTEINDAIWLQTQEGENWVLYLEEDEELDAIPPTDHYEIARYICHEYVLSQAGSWSNDRIRQYEDMVSWSTS